MKVESIFTVSSLVLVSICVAQPVAQDIEGPSSSVTDVRRTKRTPFGLGLVKLGALGVGAVGALGAAKAFHHFGGYGYGGKYYGGDNYYGGGYGYKKPYADYGYVGYESYPVVYKAHYGGHGGGFHEEYEPSFPPGGYGHGGYGHGGYGHGGYGHGGYAGDYGPGGGSVASASASAYASSSSGGGSW